jgi:hypothetical protein
MFLNFQGTPVLYYKTAELTFIPLYSLQGHTFVHCTNWYLLGSIIYTRVILMGRCDIPMRFSLKFPQYVFIIGPHNKLVIYLFCQYMHLLTVSGEWNLSPEYIKYVLCVH